MPNGMDKLKSRLAEAKANLDTVRPLMRRGRNAQIVGTLVGLVIVGVVVVTLLTNLLALKKTLPQTVTTAFAEDAILRTNLRSAAMDTWRALSPVYAAELKQRYENGDFDPVAKAAFKHLSDDVAPAVKDVVQKEINDMDLAPLLKEQAAQLIADVRPTLVKEIKGRIEALDLNARLQEEMNAMFADVSQTLSKELENRLNQPDLAPLIQKEMGGLLAEVTSELARQAQAKVAQLELAPFLTDEFGKLSAEVGPMALEQLKSRASDTKLLDTAAGELRQLAQEVGPVYLSEMRAVVEEVGLPGALRASIQDVAAQVGPQYLDEFHRVAPQIMKAARSEIDGLAEDIAYRLKERVQEEMQATLLAKKAYIEQETGLTPDQVTQKLASVVVAVQEALLNLVKQRTDRYQADLQEINQLLARIPDSQHKDPDWLVDEMVNVSLQLLKSKLPDYKSELEWPGGEL